MTRRFTTPLFPLKLVQASAADRSRLLANNTEANSSAGRQTGTPPRNPTKQAGQVWNSQRASQRISSNSHAPRSATPQQSQGATYARPIDISPPRSQSQMPRKRQTVDLQLTGTAPEESQTADAAVVGVSSDMSKKIARSAAAVENNLQSVSGRKNRHHAVRFRDQVDVYP